MKTVIQIHAIPSSGTTLLGLMLGSHSRILMAGELFVFATDDWDKIIDSCFCGSGTECEFWPRFRDIIQDGPIDQIYPKMFDELDISIIVDSSYTTTHSLVYGYDYWLRKANEMCDDSVECQRVHMICSPQSTVGSLKKRNCIQGAESLGSFEERKERGPGSVADHALRWMEENRILADRLDDPLVVKCEDLVENPKNYLTTLLAKWDLNYEEGQERYWEFEQHAVWGSIRCRRSESIRENLWKSRLSRDEVKIIWNVDGVKEMAYEYGYERLY